VTNRSRIRGRRGRAFGLGRWPSPGLLAALACVAALLTPARACDASPTIDVRFSVKVILEPGTHLRPPMASDGSRLTDDRIALMFRMANDSLLATFSRGYRFVATEVLNIGSCSAACDSSDPSFWYAATLPDTSFDMKRFEYWAKLYPAAFAWRTNAVNVYITAGKGNGAVASFPPPDQRSNDVVIAGGGVFDPGFNQVWSGAVLHHEMGHYFSLKHPNSGDGCCNASLCIRDADNIADTLPDGSCFTLDQISMQLYGLPFVYQDAVKQDSLLNMFWNNMGYLHPDQKDDPGEGFGKTFLNRMTELQLDCWTDTANGVRASVASGRTRFVNATGCGICPPATGTSTDPFIGISDALGAASAGDILLLRPGTYVGPTLIDQPVTLRATRRGAARLSY
jgi:hypothetical protein